MCSSFNLPCVDKKGGCQEDDKCRSDRVTKKAPGHRVKSVVIIRISMSFGFLLFHINITASAMRQHTIPTESRNRQRKVLLCHLKFVIRRI